MELLKQNKGKIVEKNYPESKSSFKKPSVLVKNNQDNKKNYIKFMALMKKKTNIVCWKSDRCCKMGKRTCKFV